MSITKIWLHDLERVKQELEMWCVDGVCHILVTSLQTTTCHQRECSPGHVTDLEIMAFRRISEMVEGTDLKFSTWM